MVRTPALVYSALVALLPLSADAITLVQVLGVFNLFVGLFVTATFFVFITGTAVYFMRLGTWPTYRDTAIETMEWGVAMMFVLLFILGVVQFFQRHSRIALTILAVALILVILYYILKVATKKEEKKKPAAGGGGGPH